MVSGSSFSPKPQKRTSSISLKGPFLMGATCIATTCIVPREHFRFKYHHENNHSDKYILSIDKKLDKLLFWHAEMKYLLSHCLVNEFNRLSLILFSPLYHPMVITFKPALFSMRDDVFDTLLCRH
jgi:hypothetical protein